MSVDGRHFISILEARAIVGGDGRISLHAPRPGLWRDAPLEGSLIRPGAPMGALEILGQQHRLLAPKGAFGVVTTLPHSSGERPGRRTARLPVDHATTLMVLDPDAVGAGVEHTAASAEAEGGGPVFRTPLGGRYYARPAPDREAFVQPGDALSGGETIALIEVMKTFNRVQYSGEPATVRAIVPADGDDLETGDVILELEHT